MSHIKQILTLVAAIGLTSPVGCEEAATGPGAQEDLAEEEPAEELPPDVFEAGWDEISDETRRNLLRTELDDTIAELREASGSRPELRRHAALLLSTLRAELASTPAGRAEYRAMEQEVESLSGDE